MKPQFCPANGKLDLDRLRLVADNITVPSAVVAAMTTGIQDMASVLGVTVENLDLQKAAASSDYSLYVGDGTKAIEPNRTLRISYVGPATGYIFVEKATASTVSHEFGHLLGLADRYYEGYDHTLDQEGTRTTVPMGRSLFPNEPGYDPATNLMSDPSQGSWGLSIVQIQTILSCQEENSHVRNVVGLFDATRRDMSWTLPATMELKNGHLHSGNVEVAGYTLAAAVLFISKAGHTGLKNKPVREVWHRRSRKDASGNPAIRVVRGGVLHKGGRTEATGPRIHRRMMKLIGQLAGS